MPDRQEDPQHADGEVRGAGCLHEHRKWWQHLATRINYVNFSITGASARNPRANGEWWNRCAATLRRWTVHRGKSCTNELSTRITRALIEKKKKTRNNRSLARATIVWSNLSGHVMRTANWLAGCSVPRRMQRIDRLNYHLPRQQTVFAALALWKHWTYPIPIAYITTSVSFSLSLERRSGGTVQRDGRVEENAEIV